MHDRNARRIGQIHRPADQRHVGAGARGGCGDGVALLAGRTVGDIAHRIDRLVRRARRDQHALAFERLRLRREQILDRGGDLQWLGHAAEPALALLSHFALVGTDEGDAVGNELREITLRRLVRPHVRVHRRCEKNFRPGGKQHRGGEIGGQAVHHLGHQVGGRRRDDNEIGLARETDVADVEFAAGIE